MKDNFKHIIQILTIYLGVLSIVLLLASCAKKPYPNVSVALDPMWSSLAVSGRDTNVTAFSIELLEALGAEEGLNIWVYKRSWDNLMLGLQTHEYDAICTPLEPYLFYEKIYSFSDVYLPTGPVIVTSVEASWKSLDELKGHVVAIMQGSSSSVLLEKYPTIIQHSYTSVQQGLNDVKEHVADAMLLDILTAEAFIQDLYFGQLKICSPPLTPEGLRIVTLEGKSQKFIKQFNRGLARLKSKKIYQKIAQKWGLLDPNFDK